MTFPWGKSYGPSLQAVSLIGSSLRLDPALRHFAVRSSRERSPAAGDGCESVRYREHAAELA